MGTDVTDDNPNPSNVTVTAGEFITLLTNNYTSVTSSPITHTDPYHLLNSTTLSYDSTVFRSTQEMASDETKTESTLHSVNPEDTVSTSTLGNLTENYESPTTRLNTENGIVDEDAARTHLLLLIMVPMFILIIVAGLLYRRHLIKERMDLPPPFKPPPPPVKYTTVRCHETPVKQFAISRCNSESESHILMNSP
uniref:T-cell surface protein tactile n=1 Tax=Monopterus albus TaxID=43700 RepID=UPI0009B36A36|nr:T-cell surface protein tactile-like [Monopterus albus]